MDGREMTCEELGVGEATGLLSNDEKSQMRDIEDYENSTNEEEFGLEVENELDSHGKQIDEKQLHEEAQIAREHEARVLERLATAEEMRHRIKEDLKLAHAVRQLAEASMRKLHLKKHMMLPRQGPLEFVDGTSFVAWCNFVVALNLACIVKHDDMSPFLEELMNHSFLLWYISELALKFAHHGRSLFYGPMLAVRWNWLDLTIVASGVIDQWLAPLFGLGGGASSLSLLRLLRMFRILRVLKMVKAFLVSDTDWILDTQQFDLFMASVIAVNAVIMSIQLDVKWDDWVWVDNGFLLIYVGDLLLRMKRWGLHFFSHATDWKWNWLDFSIVTTGIFDLWLVPGIRIFQVEVLGETQATDSSGPSRMHSIMSLVRLTRLMRVFRLVRVIRCVPPLYSLLLGVMEAFKAMQWVVVLTLLTLYGGAIVFTNLIGKGMIYEGGVAPPEAIEVFGTMSQSLFSLFELMNGDTGVIKPIETEMIGKILFAAFMIIANWAILAILTAVVSENMIATSNRLAAEEKQTLEAEVTKKQVDSLTELFLAKDPNKNGYVTRTEWQGMIDDGATRLELTEGTHLSNGDMMDLFDCLAVDGNKDNELEGKDSVAYIHLIHSLRTHHTFADKKSVLHVMMRMRTLQEQVQSQLNEQHKEMMNMSHRIETHVRGEGASL